MVDLSLLPGQYAREEMLDSWEIYYGNRLVERHCLIGSAENHPNIRQARRRPNLKIGD